MIFFEFYRGVFFFDDRAFRYGHFCSVCPPGPPFPLAGSRGDTSPSTEQVPSEATESEDVDGQINIARNHETIDVTIPPTPHFSLSPRVPPFLVQARGGCFGLFGARKLLWVVLV